MHPSFVCAYESKALSGSPVSLRTYQTGSAPVSCSIWEAARATSAAPAFFPPTAVERYGPPPTYIGYLGVKEKALRLLEGSFRGLLYHSSQGPQGVSSSIRSDYIFIWEQETSGIESWVDGMSWTPIGREGDFWISRETIRGDGILKKTISIPALGRFHHLISYYSPWDTLNGNLKAPSEDPNFRNMTLRTNLASQVIMSPSSIKQSRLLGILKVNPSLRPFPRHETRGVKDSNQIATFQANRVLERQDIFAKKTEICPSTLMRRRQQKDQISNSSSFQLSSSVFLNLLPFLSLPLLAHIV